jgi:hypothetical protein
MNLDDLFNYHAPTGNQPRQYAIVRAACKEAAKAILAETPPCALQREAVMLLHSAMMKANAAIATDGAF